jgi:D-alanyl-D-alanine carboxypeptidase
MRRLSLAIALCFPLAAFAQLSPDTEKAIDALVAQQLAASGEPSVSVAVAVDGKLAYAKAFGHAQRNPTVAATPAMRYKIGSVSKQFVAAAVLLLVEDGKLRLDDKVAKFFPHLTRARDITVQQLLAHTAGYPDYYALDYATAEMRKPISADALMNKYGKKLLGFAPGTRWDYSNTDYVIAGRIIEKVSGQPLDRFIQTRILDKAGMRSAIDTGRSAWQTDDTIGYTRVATGPLRVALPEGAGWTYAAGQLAMSASDLVRWDLALINNTVLSAASRELLVKETVVPGGQETHYALGVGVDVAEDGSARWSHMGGVSGFIANNVVYPKQKLAIAVLTNTMDFRLGSGLQGALEELLLPPAPPPPEPPVAAASDAANPAPPAPPPMSAAAARDRAQAKAMFKQLQSGRPDRKAMTAGLSGYFAGQVLADLQAALENKGDVSAIDQLQEEAKGDLIMRMYRIQASGGVLNVIAMFTGDGKLAQYTLYGKPGQ